MNLKSWDCIKRGGGFLESQLERTNAGERQLIAILAALAAEDARILHLSKRIAWNVVDANNGDFYAGHHSCMVTVTLKILRME